MILGIPKKKKKGKKEIKGKRKSKQYQYWGKYTNFEAYEEGNKMIPPSH